MTTTKKLWFAEYHAEHTGEFTTACHLCREESKRKFEKMKAEEWFDSIEISDELKKINEEQPHTQWCLRHWAPAPVLGFNGLGATISMMQEVVRVMPPNINTESAMNRWITTHGPVCCLLGDEKLYEAWRQWAPKENEPS